jgi:hypothetical protein
MTHAPGPLVGPRIVHELVRPRRAAEDPVQEQRLPEGGRRARESPLRRRDGAVGLQDPGRHRADAGLGRRARQPQDGFRVDRRIRVQEEHERRAVPAPAGVAAGGEAAVVGACQDRDGKVFDGAGAAVAGGVVHHDDVDAFRKRERFHTTPQVIGAVIRNDDDVDQGAPQPNSRSRAPNWTHDQFATGRRASVDRPEPRHRAQGYGS